MFVKPLYDREEYDVFLGQGWENWVRVKVLPRDRTCTVLSKAEHVTITPKLLELIFYKSRQVDKEYPNHDRRGK